MKFPQVQVLHTQTPTDCPYACFGVALFLVNMEEKNKNKKKRKRKEGKKRRL